MQSQSTFALVPTVGYIPTIVFTSESDNSYPMLIDKDLFQVLRESVIALDYILSDEENTFVSQAFTFEHDEGWILLEYSSNKIPNIGIIHYRTSPSWNERVCIFDKSRKICLGNAELWEIKELLLTSDLGDYFG